MNLGEVIRFTASSAVSHRLRSGLTALGIAIGVTAVVLLTSIGAGLRDYMLNQFTQFGTNIIAVNPGKAKTFGMPAGVLNSSRPLSLDDARALKRLPYVRSTLPMVQGTASVEGGGRERKTIVSGTGDELPQALSFRVALGEFLPPDNVSAPRAFAVLGSKLRSELFGVRNPLGERIRVGGQRYTVIGVMESKGTMFGFDLDDAVYIPVAKGLELFNREGLFEIDVMYDEGAPVEEVVKAVSRVLIARHGGEDFTITTQQQMLEVLGSVLNVVTFAVGALGGISLLVGGVGIFTIMTIAVRERTAEIGLLQAIGARRRQIRDVFLGESLLLAGIGGVSGILLGLLCIAGLGVALPALPVSPAWAYMGLAVVVSLIIGLIAGVMPAIRAARLDPVESLRAD
ncbi:MAG: ABC transporter permease [Gammaproteobacteria bacterium]|nr:ABC transporter permease [Gammaproteobacteria bacterium]MDH5276267.1 ABC transporter permease [Gammaproteobacteria bacterium]